MLELKGKIEPCVEIKAEIIGTGPRGEAPVKGVHYWTQEDVAEIVEAAKAEIEDHSFLRNRDAPEQHPIGAISNLKETLEEVPMREFTALELSKIIF